MPLRRAIEATLSGGKRSLWSRDGELEVTGFLNQTCLGGARESLRGKSVMVFTDRQLEAAAALIELDGYAARILLCPPDIKPDYLAILAAQAGIDYVVTAGDNAPGKAAGLGATIRVTLPPTPAPPPQGAAIETEWLLLTSGTTGAPKIVRHSFESLTGAIRPTTGGKPSVWSTFYDIRRYGGLQIFLRAIVGTGSMVLSDATEPVADFLPRLAEHKASHISGTPSHWRRALMSLQPDIIDPDYVRMSGEIADQKILDDLRAAFPRAAVDHAFASTEAGVGFVVSDGFEGFPRALIEGGGDVQIQVTDDTLRLKSPRTATNYVGGEMAALRDAEGFVDTGDIVELRGERYYFVGRRGGIINVGGLKVHPEEIEQIINRHSAVQMSLVKSRKNPFTGSVVVADVVLRGEAGADQDRLRAEILSECKDALPQYKIPALLRFVPKLDIAESGKLVRSHA